MGGVSENMSVAEPATSGTSTGMRPQIADAQVVSDHRVFRRSSALLQLIALVLLLGILGGIVLAATIGGSFGVVRKLGGVDPTANEQVSSSSVASSGGATP